MCSTRRWIAAMLASGSAWLLITHSPVRYLLSTDLDLPTAADEREDAHLKHRRYKWWASSPKGGSWWTNGTVNATASWRTKAIDLFAFMNQVDPTRSANLTDIYQFGVYTGGSLKSIRERWGHHELPLRRVWGFDSFVGLQGGAQTAGEESTGWVDGAFSAADALGTSSMRELKDAILRYITGHSSTQRAKMDWFGKRVTFIPGYFNESLLPGLVQTWRMGPARYVDVDVDQYVPAVQALDWMFAEGLIRPGTYIGYDDIGSTAKWIAGESKAHLEMASKYGVHFKLVRCRCKRSNSSDPLLQRGDDHPQCPQLKNCREQYTTVFRVESIAGGGSKVPGVVC